MEVTGTVGGWKQKKCNFHPRGGMWIEALKEEETQLLRLTKIETDRECRDPRGGGVQRPEGACRDSRGHAETQVGVQRPEGGECRDSRGGACRDPRGRYDRRDGGVLAVDPEFHSRDCKKTTEGSE